MTYSGLAAFCRECAPDPGADRAVTADIATAADLADLLAGQLRKVYALAPDRPAGRQELTCAADVAEELAAVTPEADRNQPGCGFYPPPIAPLIDIPVIISPDSAPGTWRLVTHDGCEVRGAGEPSKAWVSHADCTITAEGCLG